MNTNIAFSLSSQRSPFSFHFKIFWITITLLFINLNFTFAQPSYEINFSSRNHDEVCGPVVCTPEGETIFILWSAESPDWTFTKGYSTLYNINLEGDTIRWNYQKTDTLLYYLALLYDHEGNLLIGGDAWSLDTAGNKTSKFQWFCKLTTDFEIIWEKVYRIQTTEVYFQDLSLFTEFPENCYLYGNSIMPDTSNAIYTYLFIIDSSGDSVLFYHNNDELKNSYLKSITLPIDSSYFTTHLFRGNPPPNYSGCKYIQYDMSFQKLIDWWYPSPYFGQPFYTMNYETDRYLSCGRYWQLLKTFEPAYYIRVQTMNSDFIVEDFIDLTDPDPDKPTYAAWYQCIDYIDHDKIFVGGMEDKKSTIWNPNPSWVYLACLNDDLDLIHEEYYGGDALYETYYAKATYDGGVIITGSMYNDSLQDHERDGFLMKFDSTLFVGTPELKPGGKFGTTNVFPNPGKDNFKVQSSSPVLEFDLYNSQGTQILTLRKPDQIITVQTDYLPAGIYYWVVKFDNEHFNAGKWIKY